MVRFSFAASDARLSSKSLLWFKWYCWTSIFIAASFKLIFEQEHPCEIIDLMTLMQDIFVKCLISVAITLAPSLANMRALRNQIYHHCRHHLHLQGHHDHQYHLHIQHHDHHDHQRSDLALPIPCPAAVITAVFPSTRPIASLTSDWCVQFNVVYHLQSLFVPMKSKCSFNCHVSKSQKFHFWIWCEFSQMVFACPSMSVWSKTGLVLAVSTYRRLVRLDYVHNITSHTIYRLT